MQNKAVKENHKLDKMDQNSAVWQKLTKYLAARLGTLNKENAKDLDPYRTAKVRGRLKEIDLLLGLAKQDHIIKP